MTYIEQFKIMVEELEAHPQIEVLEITINPPVTEEELNQAKKKFPLTQDMISFYKEANGLKVAWTLKDAEKGRDPYGNINILPVEETFKDWAGEIYFNEDWDEGTFKPLHPLDYFVPEACTAFYLDGSENPMVYYHYCGEEMSSMGVDFNGYLDLLLKSRGWWYWQRAVAAPEDFNEYQPLSSVEEEFRTRMPELFKDFSNENFKRMDGYVYNGQ